MSLEKENRTGGEIQLIGCLGLWELVCRQKNRGGLVVLDIKLQNKGLLLKYLHKFYNKHDVPWVNLIWSTYYENKVPHASDPCGSFWWRGIIQLTDVYRGVLKVNIADGSSTLFWKDLWQPQILSVAYSRASSYAQMKTLR